MTRLVQVCLTAIVPVTLLWCASGAVQASDLSKQKTPLAEQSARDTANRAARGVVAKAGALESVLGREVRTSIEQDGGRVIDLLVDGNGRVQAAVIEFGGFLGIGTRKIAVEWSALRFESDGDRPVITVDVTRDQLRVAPEYKPAEPTVVRRASD